MKSYRLIYSRESLEDIKELRAYLAGRFSAENARAYVKRLKSFCCELAISPYRGETRQDLRPGLRSIGFERWISIVFAVADDEQVIRILSFSYAGRRLRGEV